MNNSVDIQKCVGIDYLSDWYLNSIDNETEPIWTEEHIKELCNDFYLIPKEGGNNENNF